MNLAGALVPCDSPLSPSVFPVSLYCLLSIKAKIPKKPVVIFKLSYFLTSLDVAVLKHLNIKQQKADLHDEISDL